MTKPARIIRLEPNGDPITGIGPWEPVIRDGAQVGDAVDRRHRFFIQDRATSGQVRVGIWEATAYTERLENYPKDELMVVIEGSVTIIEDDGREEYFKTEDSLFMPAGFTGVWKQEEPMKKYFMVFDPHSTAD